MPWWHLWARWQAWRTRVWRERLALPVLEATLAKLEDSWETRFERMVQECAKAITAQDGYWKERFGITTLEQHTARDEADLAEVTYWRDQLGVVALERELILFKTCLHEGVIAEPARSILKEWRYQQHMLDQDTVRYVTRHQKLPESMRTMR